MKYLNYQTKMQNAKVPDAKILRFSTYTVRTTIAAKYVILYN